jgi:hypothetical protein
LGDAQQFGAEFTFLMNTFLLSRRLRSSDLEVISRQEEPHLVLLGQGLLSDCSELKPNSKVYVLQEEVKETGLLPHFEGSLEMKNAGDLCEFLLGAHLIHL